MAAAAAILEITLLAISGPFLHIFAPNLMHMLKWGPAAIKIHTGQKSKMAAAANLKSVKQPQLSHFSTDLCKISYRDRKRGPVIGFTSKIQILQNPRWRRWPSCNPLNGHNSAIFERICPKFDRLQIVRSSTFCQTKYTML